MLKLELGTGVTIARLEGATRSNRKQGEARVSFNLIDFYHNFSRLLGVDSYGLTARQVGEDRCRDCKRF